MNTSIKQMHKLRELDLQITNRCLHTCRHCCCSSCPSEPSGMSSALVHRLINEAADLGVEEIHITGGEPLLHPGLEEFIESIQRRRLKWQLQTSLPSAREFDLDLMVSGGMVMISIDGLKRTHDYYRGVGSFERAERAVRKSLARECVVRANTVVTQRNSHELEELLLFSAQLGVQIHSFFYFSPIGRGKQIARDWIPPAEYFALGRRLREFVERRRTSLPPVIYFQYGYSATSEGANNCECRARKRDFMVILANGRVLPCTWYIDSKISIGSVEDTPLGLLYEKLLLFVDDLECLPQGCDTCHLKDVCGGGCPAVVHLGCTTKDSRCVCPALFFPGCPEAKSEL